MRKFLFITLFFIIFSASLFAAYDTLITAYRKNFAVSKNNQDLLYFPNGQALRLVSFGFHNALSDLLWFQTVNYFGKHYRTDKNYYWLNHMCEMVTDLDPFHMDIYEICAMLIAWENNKPERAAQLITKAINVKPEYWRNYYLRAMNAIIFKLGIEKARDDFVHASQLPDCPVFIKELASRKISELQTPEEAIHFLKNMAEKSADNSQRQALTERYNLARHEKNIIDLQKLIDTYKQAKGSYPLNLRSLKEIGIESNFTDPFGGTYYISPEGKVLSTSNKKLLYLFSERPENEKGNTNK